jgi:phospholipase/carboxylesterase
MMLQLEGPSRLPKSGGKAKNLVVFLHGYGSSGSDLISLAPYWADVLPDTEFLSPNAPFPCEINPYGYQWFGFEDRATDMLLGAARTAAGILDAYLDDALKSRGLRDRNLALVGFSQGTMMSLHVGPRRAEAPAAIVGYSGSLIAPQVLVGEMRSKPPVLLVHGTFDPVVPFASLAEAETALRTAGIPVITEARPGLVHSIDPVGLQMGGQFLRDHFAKIDA